MAVTIFKSLAALPLSRNVKTGSALDKMALDLKKSSSGRPFRAIDRFAEDPAHFSDIKEREQVEGKKVHEVDWSTPTKFECTP